MKAAAFDLLIPGSVAEAAAAGGRLLAGGQSLGPMMNLRVARPAVVVPIGRLAALQGVQEDAGYLTIGACVTHAQIADGGLGGGRTARIMAGIAEGIAYRAVRTRGTIAGSLCHADPAADWLTTLSALGACVLTTQDRAVPLPGFCLGAFQVDLAPGEMVRAVRVPLVSDGAGWGYIKFCRKPGEFAHAMAAVLIDGTTQRAAIGARDGAPVLLENAETETYLASETQSLTAEALRQAIETARSMPAHMASAT
jgi:carbon-monoxide dehydrogenase medium subunit